MLTIYEISAPLKGDYAIGHQYKTLTKNSGKFIISIFYPTTGKGKKVFWIPNKNYDKLLYDIFHVDPEVRMLPKRVFDFAVSYIHRVYLPV